METMWKYFLSIVISVCGFLIAQSYNNLSKNIAILNASTAEMRIQITQIQSSILSEDRVKEIVEMELLKKGIK